MSIKECPGTAPGISSSQGRNGTFKSSGLNINVLSLIFLKGEYNICCVEDTFVTYPVTSMSYHKMLSVML